MEGFRLSLERAIRMEDEIDWSVHTVDYVMFKRRLKVFAKRRSRLRELIRASPEDRLDQNVVTAILGPIAYQSPALAFLGMKAEEAKQLQEQQQQQQQQQQDYVPFVESATSSLTGMQLQLQQQQQQQQHPVMLHGAMPQTSTIADHPMVPPPDEDEDPPHDLLQTSHSDSSIYPSHPPLPHKPIKRLKKRAIWRGVSNAERNELVLFLTWEMDKVEMFYLARWQRISQLLMDHRQQQPSNSSNVRGAKNNNNDNNNNNNTAMESLGDEILELIAFCTINVVTVRQILIRYDAFARSFEGGTPLLHYYMKRVSKRQTSFKRVLFHEELQALADTFMSDVKYEPGGIWTTFEGQRKLFQDILESTQRSEAIASTGHELFTDNFVYTLRHWFLLGGALEGLGLQPEFMTQRGQSLTSEMVLLAEWRKQKHLQAEPPPPPDTGDRLTPKEIFHLALTLIATFLYCMNYYIVEPSSTMYCNALGAYDAMQGFLIGMTPLGAFISAIPYSMWTNRTFRSPVILSGCLLILGNLLYASAYNLRRIEVALAGRFLVGLGAPKVIVRRYMADTTPVSLRTSVNAAFGMVVAVGSAFGPATAIWLNGIFWKREIPFLGTLMFNGLTGPGYLMTTLWVVYTTIVLITFGEPKRQGLEEQKRMERKTPLLPANSNSASGHVDGATSGDPKFISHEKPLDVLIQNDRKKMADDQELRTIFSADESRATLGDDLLLRPPGSTTQQEKGWYLQAKEFLDLITLPVRVCLVLLLAKVFAIEMLASSTSAITKNRYHWRIHQVGALGAINGLLVIPVSILVGKLSMSQQDRTLMTWLVAIGCFGFFVNIDLTDLVSTPTHTHNNGHVLAVSPTRYVIGYFLTYSPIQCFEGIIGSALSKVIPTALASGTLNSGLLATLVDTFGRACGDIFISMAGFLNLRQLMNLLFIPGFLIMLSCLVIIRKFHDVLAI